ncbi:MAG: peptidoglycan D,D-transpeptidase FtsI family protein [Deinococcales bacterium]
MIFLPRREKQKRPPGNPLVGLAVFLNIAMGLYVVRLYQLQIVEHKKYSTLSKENRLQPRTLRAVRGEIRASDGTVLVTNRNAVELVYKGGEVQQLERIARLAGLTLPLPQPKPGEYEVVVKKDVPAESIISLEEWLAGQSEVLELRYRVQRVYPTGLAGNLLGYMNPVSEKDLLLGKYDREDLVPQAGLESGLEDLLRGRHGEKLEEVDAKGRVVPGRDRIVREAERGKTVTLSIDPKLQRAAEQAIVEAKDEINALNRKNGKALIEKAQGAIVALNPKTGQVLALAVGPKYDPNWFSSRPKDPLAIAALKDGKYKPMWNRAIKQFEQGSVFKLVTNSALLEAGAGNRTFSCSTNYRYGRLWWNWNRVRNMGAMDARKAIAWSCNTWYYQSAVSYGPIPFAEMLAKRASEFGYGQPTGIELNGEQVGKVPSPSIFEAEGRKWEKGESLNFSIGQGEMRASVLQVARMLSTIVNDGKRPELTIIKAIDGKPQAPKPMYTVAGTHWNILKQGMRLTVTTGTAKQVLGDFPIPTAGKTGTAQNPKGAHQDHAWYMGYGPFENPNLVVVAFFENGVEGSGIALPAVKKVMAAYWNIALPRK